MGEKNKKENTDYTLAVDCGTTSVRVATFNPRLELYKKGCFSDKVNKIESKGEEDELLVEIDPKELIEQIQGLLICARMALPKGAKFRVVFCAQRNSIVFWEKSDRKEVTKIICWSDKRSAKAVEAANNSMLMKLINFSGGLMYYFTRKPRFAAAKRYSVQTGMIIHRLTVTLAKNKKVKELQQNGSLAFGCLDTWLLMRLSEDNPIIAEASNISVSGLYDPYTGDFSNFLVKFFDVPYNLLPAIADSNLANVDKNLVINEAFLGEQCRVRAVLADQQAAMYGCGQWRSGDVKITLGTGTFVNVNTGKTPKTSMSGLYPVVGWSSSGDITYLLEGCAHDTVIILKWLLKIGLCDKVEQTSDIAEAVKFMCSVMFIPAFCGIQAPINNDRACAGFFGLTPDTTKEEMLCAILQSICFRAYQIFLAAQQDVEISDRPIRVCGGVSNNDFICQTIADLLNRQVQRLEDTDYVAAKGVAMFAAFSNGEITEAERERLIVVNQEFHPNQEYRPALMKLFASWSKAMNRSLSFYD